MFAAVAAGHQRFERSVLATAGVRDAVRRVPPGLAEFAPELPILLVDGQRRGSIVEVNLRDLLPGAFILQPHSRAPNPEPQP